MSNAFYIYFCCGCLLLEIFLLHPKCRIAETNSLQNQLYGKVFQLQFQRVKSENEMQLDVKHALTLPKADNTSYTIKHAQYRAN